MALLCLTGIVKHNHDNNCLIQQNTAQHSRTDYERRRHCITWYPLVIWLLLIVWWKTVSETLLFCYRCLFLIMFLLGNTVLCHHKVPLQLQTDWKAIWSSLPAFDFGLERHISFNDAIIKEIAHCRLHRSGKISF